MEGDARNSSSERDETRIREALRRLDREFFEEIPLKEGLLLEALQKLKDDERRLEQALSETKASAVDKGGRRQLDAEAKEDDAAIARLKEALMVESSDTDDEEDMDDASPVDARKMK
jgi:hypothetical protein